MKPNFEAIESHLQQGQTTWAREKLNGLRARDLSRNETLKAANLCRRSDLHYLAIKLLNPYIHGEYPGQSPASPVEVAEYAVSLTRIGASRNALILLSPLSGVIDHRLDFAWFATLFARWRYDQAIPYLERYIGSREINSYEHRVGEVNLLAASLFVQDFERASKLIASLKTALRSEQKLLLLANVHELSAQLEIRRGEYARAKEDLDECLRLIDDPKSIYSLYAEKWLAVANMLENGVSRSGLERLENVRQKAALLRHWETVRDCDFERARALKDEELFLQLYFGTPYDRYREKVIRELPPQYQIPSSYSWAPQGKAKNKLDLILAEAGAVSLKPDNLVFLLLHTLFLDFYAALSTGAIFAELFQGHIFDPDHSPDRVLQLVRRLRAFLRSNRIPLEVLQDQGEYRIGFLAPYEVRVPGRFHPQSAKEIYLRRLLLKWKYEPFSAQDGAKHLEVSRATAVRILGWGIEKGLVKKTGRSSDISYRIHSSLLLP